MAKRMACDFSEADWMAEGWVVQHPPWSFTSTIKVPKFWIQWGQFAWSFTQEVQLQRRRHKCVNSWERWWRAAVLHWHQRLGTSSDNHNHQVLREIHTIYDPRSHRKENRIKGTSSQFSRQTDTYGPSLETYPILFELSKLQLQTWWIERLEKLWYRLWALSGRSTPRLASTWNSPAATCRAAARPPSSSVKRRRNSRPKKEVADRKSIGLSKFMKIPDIDELMFLIWKCSSYIGSSLESCNYPSGTGIGIVCLFFMCRLEWPQGHPQLLRHGLVNISHIFAPHLRFRMSTGP